MANTNPLFSLFNHHEEDIEIVLSEETSNLPEIPSNLVNKFGSIKFMLGRSGSCLILSEDDELFVTVADGLIVNDGFNPTWKRFTIGFKNPNERIVHVSASYHACVLILQSGSQFNNISTRVFVGYVNGERADRDFGEEVTEYSDKEENLLDGDENSNIIWYHLKDFELNNGEYVNYSSCAAFACSFITSHGRLFACGSNQFAELAQPTTGFRTGQIIPKVNQCCLDPLNECENPFFIKTVNGDHNIIGITKDHNIFYCGYDMEFGGKDLEMMRQLKRVVSLEYDEYFIDICASYYRRLYLTNKFNLYQDDTFFGNIMDKIGETVVSCRMCGSASKYYLLINNYKIFSLEEDSFTLKLMHTVTNPRPFKTLQIATDESGFVVAYWKCSTESKNLMNQKENLKKRVYDNLLSDIRFN